MKSDPVHQRSWTSGIHRGHCSTGNRAPDGHPAGQSPACSPGPAPRPFPLLVLGVFSRLEVDDGDAVFVEDDAVGPHQTAIEADEFAFVVDGP